MGFVRFAATTMLDVIILFTDVATAAILAVMAWVLIVEGRGWRARFAGFAWLALGLALSWGLWRLTGAGWFRWVAPYL